MKQLLAVAVLAAFGLGACGGGEVSVQASLERPDGSAAGLAGLLVRALPYDRDSIFAELERSYGRPQPTVPAALDTLQEAIARAQSEWSRAETLWNGARDSLKVLSERLGGMDRATSAYALAFREFDAQDAMVQRTEREMKGAFARFEQLQQQYTQQVEDVKRARAQWEEAAFAKIDSVIRARTEESGLRQYADTTDQWGVVAFQGIKKGQYWIHARFELPYQELYWNVPIEVRGEPVTVQLNRQTAQVRPLL